MKTFSFCGCTNGWIFLLVVEIFLFVVWPLVVLTVVGSEFGIDGGDGLGFGFVGFPRMF